jgi:hypothetical protein
MEIGHRPAQYFVENLVRSFGGRAVGSASPALPMERPQSASEGNGLLFPRLITADRDEHDRIAARAETQAIAGPIARHLAGLWIECEGGASMFAVEPSIVQYSLGRAGRAGGGCATMLALETAHLEKIGEIAVEIDHEPQLGDTVGMIADRQPLIGHVPPQKHRAHHVQRVLPNQDLAAGAKIWIGQVDRQHGVVVAHTEAQQQRLIAIQRNPQIRKKPGVVVKQAVRSAGGCADVAVAVHHREGVTVFERAAGPRHDSRRGTVKWHLGDPACLGCRRRDMVDRHDVISSVGLSNAKQTIESPRRSKIWSPA